MAAQTPVTVKVYAPLMSPRAVASLFSWVAVIDNALAVPLCVIEVIFALFVCSASRFVAMLALVSRTVIDATLASVNTVDAVDAVTPETVAVKLLNLAVRLLLY